MPGQLKPSAACPMCLNPLEALVDTTNSKGVAREYFHAKPANGRRHARFCVMFFGDLDAAQRERRGLEVKVKTR